MKKRLKKTINRTPVILKLIAILLACIFIPLGSCGGFSENGKQGAIVECPPNLLNVETNGDNDYSYAGYENQVGNEPILKHRDIEAKRLIGEITRLTAIVEKIISHKKHSPLDLKNLEKIIPARNKKLGKLIRLNSAAVLKLAKLTDIEKKIPKKLTEFIEKKMALTGMVEIIDRDFLSGNSSERILFIRAEKEKIPYYPARMQIELGGGEKIKTFGGIFIPAGGLASEGFDIISTLSDNLPQLVDIEKVAVIIIKFSDTEGCETFTNAKSRAKSEVFDGDKSVARFIEESSYGKASIDGEVVCITLSETFEYYSNLPGNQYGQVVVDAVDQEIDFTGYKHIVTLLHKEPCGASGTTWKNEYLTNEGIIHASFAEVTCLTNLYNSAYIISHELLHGYGMNHGGGYLGSNNLVFEDPYNPKADASGTPQYDDQFDALGSVTRQVSMFRKERLGWTLPSNTLIVSENGIYNLEPMEIFGTSVKHLKIFIAGNNYYSIEYRRPLGIFDTITPPATGEGVLIRYIPENLVTTPAGPMDSLIIEKWGCTNAAAPGCINKKDSQRQNLIITTDPETHFYDSYRNISVSVVSMDEERAEVYVEFGE